GEQIASGQPNDLVDVPETRSHDLRFLYYSWPLCAKADTEGAGKGDCSMVLATLRARLWVARKLLPIRRTWPWTVRSKRICPSRVQSWLRTVNFVAPLTVVAARCVSLPAVYFSTVVLKISKSGTSLELRSPSRTTRAAHASTYRRLRKSVGKILG